ncbi:hypothetical protein Tco_1575843 [Tanacetum coccineum]
MVIRLLRYAIRVAKWKLIYNSIIVWSLGQTNESLNQVIQYRESNCSYNVSEQAPMDELTVEKLKDGSGLIKLFRPFVPSSEDIYALLIVCKLLRKYWLRGNKLMKGSDIVKNVGNHGCSKMHSESGCSEYLNQEWANGVQRIGSSCRNCTSQTKGWDACVSSDSVFVNCQKEEAGIQLQAEEFDLMAAAADLDEIEEVNANCILMANLQQAIGHRVIQTDNAPSMIQTDSAEAGGGTVDSKIILQLSRNTVRTLNIISASRSFALEVEKVNSVNRKQKKTNADLTHCAC